MECVHNHNLQPSLSPPYLESSEDGEATSGEEPLEDTWERGEWGSEGVHGAGAAAQCGGLRLSPPGGGSPRWLCE